MRQPVRDTLSQGVVAVVLACVLGTLGALAEGQVVTAWTGTLSADALGVNGSSPVAAPAKLQPQRAHLWRVAGATVAACRSKHPAGSLLLELWESVDAASTAYHTSGALAAVLSPQPLDLTAWNLSAAPATQVDAVAAEGQLSYQRVWSAPLSSVLPTAEWSVAVISTRHDPVSGYHLRLTCGSRLPCPEPVLAGGRCSGNGACVTPPDAAQPRYCNCNPGWADFGCSVEAPLLDPAELLLPTLPPAGAPTATGSFPRTLHRLQVPRDVSSVLLQLSTLQLLPATAPPARPQLCIAPLARAARATAPLPLSAFNCTPLLPTGNAPALQYFSLGTPCFSGAPPAACLPLQGNRDLLVALVNHHPTQAAAVSLQPMWSRQSLAVCPADCSSRGPCLLSGAGDSKCGCSSSGYTGEYCQHLLRYAMVGPEALAVTAATATGAQDVTLAPGQALMLAVAVAPGTDPWAAPFWVRLRLVGLLYGTQVRGRVLVSVRRAGRAPDAADAYKVFEGQAPAGSLEASLAAYGNSSSAFDDQLSAKVSAAIRTQLQAVGSQGAALLQLLNQGGQPVRLLLELGPLPTADPPPGPRTRQVQPPWQPMGMDWRYLILAIGLGGAVIMTGLMLLLRMSMMRQLRRFQSQLLANGGTDSSTKGVPPALIATFPTYSFTPPVPSPPPTTTAAPPSTAAPTSATAQAAPGNHPLPDGSQAVAHTGQAGPSSSATTHPLPPATPHQAHAGRLPEPSEITAVAAAAGAAGAAGEGRLAASGSAASQQPDGEAGPPACAVCLAEYEAGDQLRRLPCGHDFHMECIDSWLATSSSCPICRLELLPPSDDSNDASAELGSSTGARGAGTAAAVGSGGSGGGVGASTSAAGAGGGSRGIARALAAAAAAVGVGRGAGSSAGGRAAASEHATGAGAAGAATGAGADIAGAGSQAGMAGRRGSVGNGGGSGGAAAPAAAAAAAAGGGAVAAAAAVGSSAGAAGAENRI